MSKTKESHNISDNEPRSLEEALGSHYALQVSLQTLKERCHQLQVRLATVEEENLVLRERKDVLCAFKNDSSLNAISDLQDKISQLTLQKSQLSQHVFMVSQENQQLWNRLSRLTQANKSLGGHLTKISNSLSQHESGQPSRSSLDEIPLNPLKSLIQENAMLGEKYHQMVESIQSENEFSIQNLGFKYVDHEDESTLNEINKQCIKLQGIKRALADQQKTLKLSLMKQEQIAKGKIENSTCVERPKKPSKDFALHSIGIEKLVSQVAEPPVVSPQAATAATTNTHSNLWKEEKPEDRICPVCGMFFPKLRPFDDFLHHVSNHFYDDEESVLANFEIVTNTNT